MIRIAVLGDDCAGKTCYILGMVKKMMYGDSGFLIFPQKESWRSLFGYIRGLEDAELTFSECLPQSNSMTKRFLFDLMKAWEMNDRWDLDTLELADIAGSHLLHGNIDDEYLKEADCLFLCISGEHMQGCKEDIDTIVDIILQDGGGLELNSVLAQAAQVKDDKLPSICIMITQYDRVSAELRNQDALYRIASGVFPLIFSRDSGGIQRFAAICPVTLGEDFEKSGKIKPKGVEAPIYFAVYKAQLLKYQLIRGIGSLLGGKDAGRERKEVLQKLNDGLEGVALYVNGEYTEWSAYSGLNK